MKRLSELPEEALAELARQARVELPDAPAWLVESALAMWRAPVAPRPSLGRRIAAALAFDSWSVASPLTVRSALPAQRQLLFTAAGRDVDLRLGGPEHAASGDVDGGVFSIAGQVLGPGEGGEVALGCAGAVWAHAVLDDFGEFRFDGLAAGRYSVALRFGDETIVLPDIELGGEPGAASA